MCAVLILSKYESNLFLTSWSRSGYLGIQAKTIATVTIDETSIAITSKTTDMILKEDRFLTAERYENMKNKKINKRQNPKTMKIFLEI